MVVPVKTHPLLYSCCCCVVVLVDDDDDDYDPNFADSIFIDSLLKASSDSHHVFRSSPTTRWFMPPPWWPMRWATTWA